MIDSFDPKIFPRRYINNGIPINWNIRSSYHYMFEILLIGGLVYLYVRRRRQNRLKLAAQKSFSDVEMIKNDLKFDGDLKFDEFKVPKN
jgi:hypothetical protein